MAQLHVLHWHILLTEGRAFGAQTEATKLDKRGLDQMNSKERPT